MKLKMEVVFQEGESTISTLYSEDGTMICFILEDKVREISSRPVTDWKIPGKTAIPAGTYRLSWSYSNRFKRFTWELVGVEGFTGIRIHPGNSEADTEGCLLPGTSVSLDKTKVGESRKALLKLEKYLSNFEGEDIYVEIKRESSTAPEAGLDDACSPTFLGKSADTIVFDDCSEPTKDNWEVVSESPLRRIRYWSMIYQPKKGYEKVYEGTGVFHIWGTICHESETNYGIETSAIIEKDNGEILNWPATHVQFLDKE